MEQNKNSSDFAETAPYFPCANNSGLTLKTRLLLASFVLFVFMPIFLLILSVLSQKFNAERSDAKKERVIQKTAPPEDNRQPIARNIDPEKEIDRRAEIKLINLLQENWQGVLEVKDGKSLTTKNKQAALGNKRGFTVLKSKKDEVVYTVHNYFVYEDKGYGIVADDKKSLVFLLIWHTGTAKPPSTIRTIYIPSGQKIEIGKLY